FDNYSSVHSIFKDRSDIKELGVSIQNIEELEKVLDFSLITHIQLPVNLLENRWDQVIRKIIDVRKERKLKIHARSVLLQGLILSKDRDLWTKANISNTSDIFNWF